MSKFEAIEKFKKQFLEYKLATPSTVDSVVQGVLDVMAVEALENPAHPVWGVKSTIDALAEKLNRGSAAIIESIRGNPVLLLQHHNVCRISESKLAPKPRIAAIPFAEATQYTRRQPTAAQSVKTRETRARQPRKAITNNNYTMAETKAIAEHIATVFRPKNNGKNPNTNDARKDGWNGNSWGTVIPKLPYSLGQIMYYHGHSQSHLSGARKKEMDDLIASKIEINADTSGPDKPSTTTTATQTDLSVQEKPATSTAPEVTTAETFFQTGQPKNKPQETKGARINTARENDLEKLSKLPTTYEEDTNQTLYTASDLFNACVEFVSQHASNPSQPGIFLAGRDVSDIEDDFAHGRIAGIEGFFEKHTPPMLKCNLPTNLDQFMKATGILTDNNLPLILNSHIKTEHEKPLIASPSQVKNGGEHIEGGWKKSALRR